MHMLRTGIEKKADICATNPANKTKCMSNNAKQKIGKKIVV
jgi:hypothetical protein